MDTEIYKNLHKFLEKDKKNKILEIGCLEGDSTLFLSNFLNHRESCMVCVDPFIPSGSTKAKNLGITSKNVTKETENIFRRNISRSPNYTKVVLRKILSDTYFEYFDETFNFIYVDGCHEDKYLARDIRNSFNSLEKGGILWMDDYGGNYGKCKKVIDLFLEEVSEKIEIIHKGYQIAIRNLG